MARLDATTLAEYAAAATASAKVQAVIDALANAQSPQAVTVRIRSGASPDIMATGTMANPWATQVGGQLVVGELTTALDVLKSGTPDANWTIEFSSGSRWLTGTFGLAASGKEFTWSLASFDATQSATFGTVEFTSVSNSAPQISGAPTALTLQAGSTYAFAAHVADADGDALTYSLVSPYPSGYAMTAAGVMTAGTASGAITWQVSDGALTVVAPTCQVTIAAGGTILWNGDFSTGNFTQWPNNSDNLYNVGLLFCPPRGAPAAVNVPLGNTYSYRPAATWVMDGQSYTWGGGAGDGSNVNLVRTAGAAVQAYAVGNTRGSSQYAARFVAKARPPSVGGIDGTGKEPDDGDIPTLDLDRRRSELQVKNSVIKVYSPNVHLKTRWYSISIFNPSNQPGLSGSTWGGDWGPSHFGLLKVIQRPGGVLGIGRDETVSGSGGWEISTDHSDNPNTLPTDPLSTWYQTCRYRVITPTEDPELIPDFPDQAASIAALSDPNIGGWTDFVIKIKFDYRVPSDGGVGKLDVWMRKGSSAAIDAYPQPWVHVIQQLPKVLARTAQINLNRGIGFNFVDGNNGGSVGPYIGNYMSKGNVWGMPRDFVVHIANCKIGDDSCTFSQMSPDGSSAS